MLLSQQPHSCIASIAALPAQAASHYDIGRLFNALVSPPNKARAGFTEEKDMSWMKRDGLVGRLFSSSGSPQTARKRSRSVADSQNSSITSQGVADEELQAELRRSIGRWKDHDMNMNASVRQEADEPKQVFSRRRRRSSGNEVDVFEVQRRPDFTPNYSQLDNDANQPGYSALSLTDKTPEHTYKFPQTPTSWSTDPDAQAVNTTTTRRLRSPLQSPQRDPRTLFGTKETHLPWVTRLSPNRFTMNVSPDWLTPDAAPMKSIWDAEDDEFDRWPTAAEAEEELDTVRRNATTKRGTFIRHSDPELTVVERIAEAVDTPMGDATRSLSEQEQTILELEDMDCGNPSGRDLHDDIIAPFRSRDYDALPASAPARHVHALDARAYTSSSDPVVRAARPRLCDAVATILAYTSPSCLADFLNPEVEVFEWRRLINCVMIRREGSQVTVGTYYNYGTTYQWGFLVRSHIDEHGAWTETWASASQGTTPLGKDGVMFDRFEAKGANWGVEPDDEEYALYAGRQLADFLLRYEVWNYYKWWRYGVEWETDGKLTRARDANRYPAGLTFE